jgi:hypothetical protein
MIQILKVTKATWILNVILLVLLLSASMARAGNYFGFNLFDLTVPPNLVGTQLSITPVSPDWDTPGYAIIDNRQPVSAKITAAWLYFTDDTSPIYDMATYRLEGGSKVNLSQPQGSKSQAGTFTVEIPPIPASLLKLRRTVPKASDPDVEQNCALQCNPSCSLQRW